MLVRHNLFRPDGFRLTLPRSDRAVAHITHGTIVYVMPPRRPDPDQPLELFASPFAYERWSDLWQLEMLVRDRPGLLADVVALLKRSGIVPLTLETCAFDIAEHHKILILCDCRDYQSALDLDHRRRKERERMTLSELHATLSVEFIEDLAFTNGTEPHIRLGRNEAHFRAARNAAARRRKPEAVVVEGNTIELPLSLVRQIESDLRAVITDLRYFVVPDPLEGILRFFFFVTSMPIVRIRATLSGPIHELLASTLDVLRRRNFNVLSIRMRFGYSGQGGEKERMNLRVLDLFAKLPDKLADRDETSLKELMVAVSTELSATHPSGVLLNCSRLNTHECSAEKVTDRPQEPADRRSEESLAGGQSPKKSRRRHEDPVLAVAAGSTPERG
jgi:hypothetical protein